MSLVAAWVLTVRLSISHHKDEAPATSIGANTAMTPIQNFLIDVRLGRPSPSSAMRLDRSQPATAARIHRVQIYMWTNLLRII